MLRRRIRLVDSAAEEHTIVFYKGEMARAIADYMAENGGFLSYEDLATHRSEWVEPVSTSSAEMIMVPVVARIDRPPEFLPDPREVELVLEATCTACAASR